MDRDRFDALARLLATTTPRRAAFGTLLGIMLLGQTPDVLAKRDKGKARGQDNQQGHGNAGVQDEGRPGAARKAHHKRKQTRRQRRKQRDRNDGNGDNDGNGGNQKPGREDGVCCGATTICEPPAPGSNRAGCDFSRQSFAGQDLHGVDFFQIEGAAATFDGAALFDAVFTEACLRQATFLGADLENTTWDGACLFAADFTDADLGGNAEALDAAVLCATILPDGSRSDRDCGRFDTFACCLPPASGGGGGGRIPCKRDEDCPAFLECSVQPGSGETGYCVCTNHSCAGCCGDEDPISGFPTRCYPGNTDAYCGQPPKAIAGNFCQTCLAGTACIEGACAPR